MAPQTRRVLGPGVRWRAGVPVVCLSVGMLLAVTHTVSDGREIRRSDSPRLVDLVGEAQTSVDRLARRYDDLSAQIARARAAAVGADVADLRAAAAPLQEPAGITALSGSGLVVTLTDAARDADGRYPTDAAPDDLVVHQQDIEAVLAALWAGGAEAVALQDQRIVASSAPLCVGNTLLIGGRTYSPPYVVTAIGDAARLEAALDDAPMVALYRRYVARYGLGYTEERVAEARVPAHAGPPPLRHAVPSG